MLSRKVNLFKDAFVAIDGSKFKAVNSRRSEQLRLARALKRRLKQTHENIARVPD